MIVTSTNIIKKLLILFLTFAGLYFAKDFLIPLAIGAVLATLALPFCSWMELKKLPRALAVCFCLLSLLLLIAGVFTLLGWQFSEFSSDLEAIKQKISSSITRAQAYLEDHFGISAKEQVSALKTQGSALPNMMQVLADSLVYVLTGFILVLVYMVFLLYYRDHLRNFILKLFTNQQTEAKEVVYKAARVSQQYLLGLAKMIGCLWIMYGIGFSIIGIKNPLFYAFLCGLLEIVPYIGNITGTAISLMGSAAQGAETGMLVGIVITYGTVQFIQGWMLEPLIVGPQVKINPLVTIIALVLGQLLWGIPGVVLAIPLTGMFKIICDHIESLKPYGFLLGETKEKKKESGWSKKIRSVFRKKAS